ncbi:hypothetical protein [Spongiivirga citrea]|uniref:DUF4381 family protein n=1 Tax=Spongiivirga citrea TaxID=1481457 RepID=A0A6M0CHC4_9FLAO|nr:hypothetical protein [Spongiivirga citrea]NER17251.1 hypothetical protein [Spongiivirga citrea]
MNKTNNIKNWISNSLLVVLMLFVYGIVNAQSQPKVSATVDTFQIKIGEEIKLSIRVEVDSTDLVIFPEGQSFSPMETIESYPVDTAVIGSKFELIKKYGVTQFDSGFWYVPKQRISINEKPFFTDSIPIRVNDVVVDTTKQAMFEIKPLISVKKPKSNWLQWLLIGLGVLLFAAIVIYFLFLRKKPETEEERVANLTPFDRALEKLKALEESQYLIRSEHKKYYSELTDIVRIYIEEDVHLSAMESTSDELIAKLEMLKDADKLPLENETISNFKQVLKTADLVKFARLRPEETQVKTDTTVVEQMVTETKEVLPEDTEDEKLADELYAAEVARKRRNRMIRNTVIITTSVLLIAGFIYSYINGFQKTYDTVFGHPTKPLLEQEWISSTYGAPGIALSTPEVLVRQDSVSVAAVSDEIKQEGTFLHEVKEAAFKVSLHSVVYKEQKEIDIPKVVDKAIKDLEKEGVQNIIVKTEKFNTPAGAEGLKTHGSASFKIDNELIAGEYALFTFAAQGVTQQLLITWADNDVYAQEIVDLIINSIELKTTI